MLILSGLAILELDVTKLLTTDKYCPCDLLALKELMELQKPVSERYMDERATIPNPELPHIQVIVIEEPNDAEPEEEVLQDLIG